MVSSGTEATMSAIRLARGFTNRDKILKFEAGFVCAAHTEQEVQATIEAAERSFAKL